MNKINPLKDKIISTALLVFLLLSAVLLFSLCYNKNYLTKNNLFRYIQYNCNIIAKVDFAKMLGPEFDKTQFPNNQSNPYFRNLAAFGINIVNIDTIYIGVYHYSFIKNIHKSADNAIILIRTKQDVAIDKAMKQALNNSKSQNSVKIAGHIAYILSSPNEPRESYLVQLSQNIILLGPKNLVENSIYLYSGQYKISKSILANTQMMKVYNNEYYNSMLSAAVIFPPEYSKQPAQYTPKINSLFLHAGFKKQILDIGCNINCASEKDAQNTCLSIQTTISFLLSRPPKKLNSNDISIKVKAKTVIINIKLDKKTLESFSQFNDNSFPDPQAKTAS